MARTNLVSSYSSPPTTEIILPKIRTSTLDQPFSKRATLNRELILSRWNLSPPRLTLSIAFFSTTSSVCSLRTPFPIWQMGTLDNCFSAGVSFMAMNLVSSSFATTGSNRGQFTRRTEGKRGEHSLFSKKADFLLISFDLPRFAGTGTISPSMPIRYSSTSLWRAPSPALVAWSGCCRGYEISKMGGKNAVNNATY